MDSLSQWLSSHTLEPVDGKDEKEYYQSIDWNVNSNLVMKRTDVSNLDSKVVKEVVSKMNRVNEMRMDGLMKYKVIEVKSNSLYRLSIEYKLHLDEMNVLKLSEDYRLKTLKGIVVALRGLDEKHIFHTDLKPSNIFLDENGVIVGDYLNSLLYKGREDTIRRNCDDLCFVSIDELLELELDISSDIWNFGLIYYYVLSGKYPFRGSSMLETMDNILNVNYERIEAGGKRDKLNSFLSKILVKEKNGRMKLPEIEDELIIRICQNQ